MIEKIENIGDIEKIEEIENIGDIDNPIDQTRSNVRISEIGSLGNISHPPSLTDCKTANEWHSDILYKRIP